MNTKNKVALLFLLGLIMVLAIVSSRMMVAKANLQYQAILLSTVTPMSRALLDIQGYEHDLQYGDINNYTRKNLQKLLTLTWKDVTQEVEEKFITLPPYNSSKFTPTPLSITPIVILGIQDDPFYRPGGKYIINNLWRGLNDDENIFIYAGCLTDNPNQGIVYYRTESKGKSSAIEEVSTEKKSGCLTIVEDVGNGKKLVLQAKNGDTYYFDIPGRVFVQSLNVVAPTITPRPTEVILPKATPTSPYPSSYPFPPSQKQAYPNP